MATVARRGAPSIARPGSSRNEGRNSSVRPSGHTTFVPERLALPLSDSARLALGELFKTQRETKQLNDRLATAIKELTDAAATLNEAGYERRRRFQRDVRRRQQNEEEPDEEENAKHEQFQSQVEQLTKKMDLSIRGVIDDQIWLEDLPSIARAVVSSTEEEQGTQRDEEYNQSPTPIASTRQTQPGSSSDEDEDSASRTSQADDGSASGAVPFTTPHALLQKKLLQQSREWQEKSLTEKYAHNNNYAGWKREVHENRNPQAEAPPMPDASLWFAAEEGRDRHSASQRRKRDGGEDESDDDEIEISREKMSYKCPITLLPFEDPVTSTKCKHSYEKAAILDMLKHSADHIPLDANQEAELRTIRDTRARSQRRKVLEDLQERRVQCPECSAKLLISDLQPNPALQRRVQRVLAAERREEAAATSDLEGSDDEDDAMRGTQRRPVGLGSSPVPSSRRQSGRPVKAEDRASVVPQTQLSNGTPSRRAVRTRVVESDDDEV